MDMESLVREIVEMSPVEDRHPTLVRLFCIMENATPRNNIDSFNNNAYLSSDNGMLDTDTLPIADRNDSLVSWEDTIKQILTYMILKDPHRRKSAVRLLYEFVDKLIIPQNSTKIMLLEIFIDRLQDWACVEFCVKGIAVILNDDSPRDHNNTEINPDVFETSKMSISSRSQISAIPLSRSIRVTEDATDDEVTIYLLPPEEENDDGIELSSASLSPDKNPSHTLEGSKNQIISSPFLISNMDEKFRTRSILDKIIKNILLHVTASSESQPVRFAILTLLEIVVKQAGNIYSKTNWKILSTGILLQCEGESDPRNLMVVFRLLSLCLPFWMGTNYTAPDEEYVSDRIRTTVIDKESHRTCTQSFRFLPEIPDILPIVSDFLWIYFPIRFRQSQSDPVGITTEELNDSLYSCMVTGYPIFTLLFPQLMERLTDIGGEISQTAAYDYITKMSLIDQFRLIEDHGSMMMTEIWKYISAHRIGANSSDSCCRLYGDIIKFAYTRGTTKYAKIIDEVQVVVNRFISVQRDIRVYGVLSKKVLNFHQGYDIEMDEEGIIFTYKVILQLGAMAHPDCSSFIFHEYVFNELDWFLNNSTIHGSHIISPISDDHLNFLEILSDIIFMDCNIRVDLINKLLNRFCGFDRLNLNDPSCSRIYDFMEAWKPFLEYPRVLIIFSKIILTVLPGDETETSRNETSDESINCFVWGLISLLHSTEHLDSGNQEFRKHGTHLLIAILPSLSLSSKRFITEMIHEQSEQKLVVDESPYKRVDPDGNGIPIFLIISTLTRDSSIVRTFPIELLLMVCHIIDHTPCITSYILEELKVNIENVVDPLESNDLDNNENNENNEIKDIDTRKLEIISERVYRMIQSDGLHKILRSVCVLESNEFCRYMSSVLGLPPIFSWNFYDDAQSYDTNPYVIKYSNGIPIDDYNDSRLINLIIYRRCCVVVYLIKSMVYQGLTIELSSQCNDTDTFISNENDQKKHRSIVSQITSVTEQIICSFFFKDDLITSEKYRNEYSVITDTESGNTTDDVLKIACIGSNNQHIESFEILDSRSLSDNIRISEIDLSLFFESMFTLYYEYSVEIFKSIETSMVTIPYPLESKNKIQKIALLSFALTRLIKNRSNTSIDTNRISDGLLNESHLCSHLPVTNSDVFLSLHDTMGLIRKLTHRLGSKDDFNGMSEEDVTSHKVEQCKEVARKVQYNLENLLESMPHDSTADLLLSTLTPLSRDITFVNDSDIHLIIKNENVKDESVIQCNNVIESIYRICDYAKDNKENNIHDSSDMSYHHRQRHIHEIDGNQMSELDTGVSMSQGCHKSKTKQITSSLIIDLISCQQNIVFTATNLIEDPNLRISFLKSLCSLLKNSTGFSYMGNYQCEIDGLHEVNLAISSSVIEIIRELWELIHLTTTRDEYLNLRRCMRDLSARTSYPLIRRLSSLSLLCLESSSITQQAN